METLPLSESERIRFLIEHRCNGSTTAFAQAVGVDKAYISRLAHGKIKLTKRMSSKILSIYPDINPEWLKTGEGYPGDLSIADVKAKYEKIIAEKDALIKTLRRVIEECLTTKLPKSCRNLAENGKI